MDLLIPMKINSGGCVIVTSCNLQHYFDEMYAGGSGYI